MEARHVLTIYGDRGWNPADSSYTQNSIIRGYAGLNEYVHRLLDHNPEAVIHSVSHSTLLYPFDSGRLILRVFVTLVYSGTMNKHSIGPPVEEDQDLPDDAGAQYDTLLRVTL